MRNRDSAGVRKVVEAAMNHERATMRIYCTFEARFPEPEEVRHFWFEMARHESRHFGALALVAALLESGASRPITVPAGFDGRRLQRLGHELQRLHQEALGPDLTLRRALEIAVEIESSEIEDLVLHLLSLLKGEQERERALQAMIHDLGDLSYMIEKYTGDRELLARADRLVEAEVGRLRAAGSTGSTR